MTKVHAASSPRNHFLQGSSNKLGGSKVRSLILFWALDFGNMELLHYLWTFDNFRPPSWGVKNLEFMLILTHDLATSDMDEVYPIEDLFTILLEPRPFSAALRTM